MKAPLNQGLTLQRYYRARQWFAKVLLQELGLQTLTWKRTHI